MILRRSRSEARVDVRVPAPAPSLAPEPGAWGRRPPVEARCGCRVDFVALGDGEYAMVFSECELGTSCPVTRYIVWEIDRTRAEVAAL